MQAEQQSELLPCPFCGGTETTPSFSGLTKDAWAYVCCDDCEACGPWVESGDGAKDRMEAAWNRRAALSHPSTPQESKPDQETLIQVTSCKKVDADPSDRNAELRQDNAMLRDALRKLLANPADAEHVQYARMALGERPHG
jgi:Lar family restriction alleviation protein